MLTLEHLERRELLAPLAVGMIPGDPATTVFVAPDFRVNALDMLGTRDNQTRYPDLADITDVYDYNRDRRVNVTDMLIARDNQTHFLNALQRITVPVEEIVQDIARMIWEMDSEADSERIRRERALMFTQQE